MTKGNVRSYQRVLKGFVFLLPFLSAFALASWMPPPMLLIVTAFFWLFFARGLGVVFLQSDTLLSFVYLLALIGGFIAAPHLGERTIMHTIAFGAVAFFYFFVVRSILFQVSLSSMLGRAFTGMMILLSLYVILEFVLSNAFGVDFDAFIPHYRSDITAESGSTIFGIFVRPRGLAEEAGHTSLLYELGLPLASLHVRKCSQVKRWGFYLLTLPAFFMLFSVAGIVALTIALAATALLKLRKRYLRHIIVGIILVGGVFIWKPNVIKPAVKTIQYKAQIFEASANNNSSAGVRQESFERSLQIAQDAPQGLGWGTIYQIRQDRQSFEGTVPPKSTISLYMEVLVACGFLGLALFLVFVGGKGVALIRMRTEEADSALVALISLGLHYIFISNFWFPIPWFVLGVSDALWVQRHGLPSTAVVLRARK